jgi:hypothetical protein
VALAPVSQIKRLICRALDEIELKWPRPQFCPAGVGRKPQGFDPCDQLDAIMLDERRGSAMARCGLNGREGDLSECASS